MNDLSKTEQTLVKTVDRARQMSMLEPEGGDIVPAEQGFETPEPQPEPEPVKAPSGKKITVKLLPTFRETINELEKRDIKMSIISLNAPGSVSGIMKAFGFADKFVDIRDSWKNKGDVLKEQMDSLKVGPNETIFVDNMRSHIDEANRVCAMGLVIGKGRDIEKPIQVLDYIVKRS